MKDMMQIAFKRALKPSLLVIEIVAIIVLVALALHQQAEASEHTTYVEVSVSGTGGTVTSSPAGINCPGDCSEDFTDGTTVTLTANPGAGYALDYWSLSHDDHPCQGGGYFYYSNPCVVTLPTGSQWSSSLGDNLSYTAVFGWQTYSFGIVKKGSGNGTVSLSPSGQSCSASCTFNLTNNTAYTLTATPAAGSTFAGWGTYAEGGTECYNASGGKGGGGTETRGTSTTCKVKASGTVQSYGTAVPFFEKATASSSPKPSTNSPAPASTPATEVKPPETPTLAEIKVGESAVSADAPIELKPEEPLVLSGKTVANGVVNIYIYSEPRKDTVTADKDGNWTYTVQGLEPGDHRIETEVIDPATNKTSERKQILTFKVLAATITATPVASRKLPVWVWLAAALPVIGVAGLLFWRLKKKHEPQPTDQPAP